MTPDDKKRIEEIRKYAKDLNEPGGKYTAEGDLVFLLAQLDEAHAALRDIAGFGCYHCSGDARKALGEE